MPVRAIEDAKSNCNKKKENKKYINEEKAELISNKQADFYKFYLCFSLTLIELAFLQESLFIHHGFISSTTTCKNKILQVKFSGLDRLGHVTRYSTLI